MHRAHGTSGPCDSFAHGGTGLELRHLRHFVAVVDAGNLSRASDAAFLSQPALTRSIRSLEDIVGAQLLERHAKGVSTTAAGRTLYDYAVFILNECAKAREEVAAAGGRAFGTVKLGCAAMFSGFIVDKAVAELGSAFPDHSISVTAGFFEELIDQVADGRLDALFSNIPAGDVLPAGVTLEKTLSVRTILVARADHPLAERRKAPERGDLARERWVIVQQPHMRAWLTQFVAAEGVAPPASITETNSLEMIRALLVRGGCIGLLPEHLVRAELRKGQLKRLPAEAPVLRKAGLFYRADAPVRPAVAHFLGAVRRHCAIESGLEVLKGEEEAVA
jgi:DNA-binding transcriptional LysR family regulator